MKIKLLFLITFQLFVGLGILNADTLDPVADFKTNFSIPTGDKILKWEANLKGDGKKEVLLNLKSDFNEEKESDEPSGWAFYIINKGAPISYVESAGIGNNPGAVYLGIMPAIDIENCFVGYIKELGKRGILTLTHYSPQVGPTIFIMYAYTLEGDHLKHSEIIRYPDSKGHLYLFQRLTH